MKKDVAVCYGDAALVRIRAAEALAARQALLPDDHPDRWCWTKEEVFQKCLDINPRATVSGFRTCCLKTARDKNGNLRRIQGVVDAVMACVVPGLYDADGNRTMGHAAFRVKVAMMKMLQSGVRHKYDNQAVLARDLDVSVDTLHQMMCEGGHDHHFNREIFELSKELFVRGYWEAGGMAGKLKLQRDNREWRLVDWVIENNIKCEHRHELVKRVGGASGYAPRTIKHKMNDRDTRQQGGPVFRLALAIALGREKE